MEEKIKLLEQQIELYEKIVNQSTQTIKLHEEIINKDKEIIDSLTNTNSVLKENFDKVMEENKSLKSKIEELNKRAEEEKKLNDQGMKVVYRIMNEGLSEPLMKIKNILFEEMDVTIDDIF